MSDLKNDSKRRPLKNLPPDRFPLKVALIWVAIIGAVLALLYLSPRNAAPIAKLKIQQVIELADAGKVESGVINYDGRYGRDGAIITGKVIKDVTLEADSVKTAQFIAAGSLTPGNLERLQKTKVFDEPPIFWNFFGSFRNSTTSAISSLASSQPATSEKVTLSRSRDSNLALLLPKFSAPFPAWRSWRTNKK